MKEQDKQILSILQAFDEKAVFKAFEYYKEGIKDKFRKVKEDLSSQGWYPLPEKPTDREYYDFDGQYWVQTEEARQRSIQLQLKSMRQVKKLADKSKTSMELGITKLKCPICNNRLYKQSICPGCKEGKQGYRIRLICEDNSDHEFLL
jgi:RNase P subunit RPR2